MEVVLIHCPSCRLTCEEFGYNSGTQNSILSFQGRRMWKATLAGTTTDTANEEQS